MITDLTALLGTQKPRARTWSSVVPTHVVVLQSTKMTFRRFSQADIQVTKISNSLPMTKSVSGLLRPMPRLHFKVFKAGIRTSNFCQKTPSQETFWLFVDFEKVESGKNDKKHQQQIQKSHEDTKNRETDNSKIPIRSRHNPVKKFRVNLRYAGIKSFLLANWTHVMILNESEGLIYSIAYIYAEYIFREFTIMVKAIRKHIPWAQR